MKWTPKTGQRNKVQNAPAVRLQEFLCSDTVPHFGIKTFWR